MPDSVTNSLGVFGDNDPTISNDHYDYHTNGAIYSEHFRETRLPPFVGPTTKGVRLVSIIANENTNLYEYRINGEVVYTSSESFVFENNINRLGHADQASLQSGNFGESIIINETANIHTEKIEGYLAHKWGIQLPDDHNYRYIYPEWCGAGNVPSPTPSPSPTITTSPTVTPSPTETPSPTVTPSPTITPIDCCEEDMLTHDLVASAISSFGEPTITATGVTQNATICIGTPSGELPYTLKLIFNGELVAILTTTGTFNNNKVYYNTEDGKCYQGIIEDDVCLLGHEPACVDFNSGSLSTQRSYNRIIFNEPLSGYVTDATVEGNIELFNRPIIYPNKIPHIYESVNENKTIVNPQWSDDPSSAHSSAYIIRDKKPNDFDGNFYDWLKTKETEYKNYPKTNYSWYNNGYHMLEPKKAYNGTIGAISIFFKGGAGGYLVNITGSTGLGWFRGAEVNHFISMNDGSGANNGWSVNKSEYDINNNFGNTWNHLGVIWNEKLSIYEFYINGIKLTTETYGTPITEKILSNRIAIGARNATQMNFKGYISDVAIYADSITENRLLQLYNDGIKGGDAADAELWYRCGNDDEDIAEYDSVMPSAFTSKNSGTLGNEYDLQLHGNTTREYRTNTQGPDVFHPTNSIIGDELFTNGEYCQECTALPCSYVKTATTINQEKDGTILSELWADQISYKSNWSVSFTFRVEDIPVIEDGKSSNSNYFTSPQFYHNNDVGWNSLLQYNYKTSLQTMTYSGIGIGDALDFNTIFEIGEWYNIVITKTNQVGENAPAEYKGYLNGELKTTQTIDQLTFRDGGEAGATLGTDYFGNFEDLSLFAKFGHDGRVWHEFAIWHRDLSISEVNQVYINNTTSTNPVDHFKMGAEDLCTDANHFITESFRIKNSGTGNGVMLIGGPTQSWHNVGGERYIEDVEISYDDNPYPFVTGDCVPSPTPSPTETPSPTITTSPTETPSPTITPSPTVTYDLELEALCNEYSVGFYDENSYVTFPPNTFKLGNNEPWTFSLKFKTTHDQAEDGWHTLFHMDLSSSEDNTSGLWFAVNYITNKIIITNISHNSCIFDADLQKNIWYHLIVIWDDNSNYNVYLNGVKLHTDNPSAPHMTEYNTDVRTQLGKLVNNNGFTSEIHSFNGLIDELSFYRRQLSDGGVSVNEIAKNDIASLYNEGVSADISPLNPSGWWRMGDERDFKQQLSIPNPSNVQFTENSRIEFGDFDFLKNATKFSFSIKYNKLSTGNANLFMAGADNNNYIGLVIRTNDVMFACRNNSSDSISYAIDDATNIGNWHTAVCVYDAGATDKLKIYYDGSLVASGTTAPVNLGDTSHTDAGLGINHGSSQFIGIVDELAIWDVALTEQEAIDICNNNVSYVNFATPAKGWWDMDVNTFEVPSDVVYDKSGNNLHATKPDNVEPTEVIYIEDYYYTNGNTTRPNGEYYSLYANDQLIDVTDGSFKLLAGLNYTFIAKENLIGGGARIAMNGVNSSAIVNKGESRTIRLNYYYQSVSIWNVTSSWITSSFNTARESGFQMLVDNQIGYSDALWPPGTMFRTKFIEDAVYGDVCPSPTPSPTITTSPTETPSPTITPSPTETPSPSPTETPSPSPTETPSPTITPLDCCEDGMLTHDLVASTISSFGEPTITATGVTQNATICIGTPSGELPYTLKLIIDNAIVAVLTTTGTFNNNKVYYTNSSGDCLQGSIVDDECVLSAGSSLNFSIEGSDIHVFEIKALLNNDSYLQKNGQDWVASTNGNELVISAEDTEYLNDNIASLKFFELSTIPNVSFDKNSCTIIDEELTFIYPIISEKLNSGSLLKCIASNVSSIYSQFSNQTEFNQFVNTSDFNVSNIIKNSDNDEFANNNPVNKQVSRKLTVLMESVKLQKNYSTSKSAKILDAITDIKKSSKAFDVSQLQNIENSNFANSVNYLFTEIDADSELEGNAFMSSLREHLNLPFQAINNMSNKAKEKLLEKMKNHSRKKVECDLGVVSCCEDDMNITVIITDTSSKLVEFENNANITISGIAESAKNSEICFSEPDTTDLSLPFSIKIKKDNAILMVLTSVGELARKKIYYKSNNICYSGIIDENNVCNLS